MRLAQVLTVSVLTLAMAASASAERRPGLGGKYAARNMTAAQGSLTILAGPTDTQTFGSGGSAGISYNNLPEIDLGAFGGEISFDYTMLTLGAAYGITPELEAGLLLPLLVSGPEGADLINTLPVFATYAMDMGNFDIGGRLTANVPLNDQDFGLGIGVPMLFRFGGNSRLDTGIFVPLTFGDETGKALNIPVRFTQSVTPKIFVGLETGLMLPDIKTDNGSIPFGIHAGYTLLAGGNVIDVAAQLMFPTMISLAEGAENPVTDVMQINAGANVQLKF